MVAPPPLPPNASDLRRRRLLFALAAAAVLLVLLGLLGFLVGNGLRPFQDGGFDIVGSGRATSGLVGSVPIHTPHYPKLSFYLSKKVLMSTEKTFFFQIKKKSAISGN